MNVCRPSRDERGGRHTPLVAADTLSSLERRDDVGVDRALRGLERKGSTVTEKKIQPKAAGTEAASKTTAAGVQKKSMKTSHKNSHKTSHKTSHKQGH